MKVLRSSFSKTKREVFAWRSCFLLILGRMISAPTSVLTAVGQMKRYTSKKVGEAIWQRSFHDHVIRNKDDYEKISKYIYENPIKWRYDCFYTEELSCVFAEFIDIRLNLC